MKIILAENLHYFTGGVYSDLFLPGEEYSMAKGAVIASKEVSFILRDGCSNQTVELKSCDQACPRIEIYSAAEGAVAAYQRDVFTHPFDGGDIEGLGKQEGYKFQGPCEHTEHCGSSDATHNRACFIK